MCSDFTEFRNELKQIEELTSLLQNENGPITDWFNGLKDSKLDIDPFTAVATREQDKNEVSKDLTLPLLPQLFQLLQECMLNQRWPDALKVLHKVVSIPLGSSHTIWKVGSELLQSGETTDDYLIKQLYDQMKHLSDLNCKEVILEFVMYLLKSGDKEGAITALQETYEKPGVKKEKGSSDVYIDKLYRAYTGLVWYIQWKDRLHRVEQLHMDNTNEDMDLPFAMLSSQSTQVLNLEMQLTNLSSRAILCFNDIQMDTAIWDIFITKHVELLVYHERKDEALVLLQTYAENNPDNPNAQKYLYTLYRDHFPDSENVLKQLKIVADSNPSDSLVLDLCTTLKAEDAGLAIPYLFRLLDYQCWQTECRAWKLMAECLDSICIQRLGNYEEGLQTITDCWSPRRTWWPPYHFTTYMVTMGTRDNNVTMDTVKYSLNFYKSMTACILCGKDNEFTSAAMDNFNEQEQEKILEIKQLSASGIT